jgi:hypothetical protein
LPGCEAEPYYLGSDGLSVSDLEQKRARCDVDAMTVRQRFQAVMNFQPFDRLPIVEWSGWWDKTVERWHTEGLPGELTDRYEICRHFGLDIYLQDWFLPCQSGARHPPRHGAGVISSMDQYEKLLPLLYPLPAVDADRWARWAQVQRRGEVALWFTLDGFFWFPRSLLGIERHLYAFYDQPELLHRMNSDLADWTTKVIDELCAVCSPDFMTFAEDMSYNHGPMLSEAAFDEFMRPYYERVVPRLKEHGIVVIVDSDGDVRAPAGWFERAGVDGMLPLERQAGVDVAEIRRQHPRMRFIGCFDKMTMNRGEQAMRAEFERLLPTASQGGLIISCDHQTPPGVSYEDYQLYLRLFREYAPQAGRCRRCEP